MLKAHNTTLQLQIHCAQEFTHRHICIMHPIITVFQAPLAFSLAHDRNQNWWWTRLAEFLEFGTELEQSELVYGFASTTVGLFFAQLPSYLCYLLLHCCLMLSFAVSCHTYTLLHILHIIAACMVHGAGAGQGIKYLRSHTQHHSARNNRSIFPIVLAASFFSLYIISSSTCSCSIAHTYQLNFVNIRQQSPPFLGPQQKYDRNEAQDMQSGNHIDELGFSLHILLSEAAQWR